MFIIYKLFDSIELIGSDRNWKYLLFQCNFTDYSIRAQENCHLYPHIPFAFLDLYHIFSYPYLQVPIPCHSALIIFIYSFAFNFIHQTWIINAYMLYESRGMSIQSIHIRTGTAIVSVHQLTLILGETRSNKKL